MTGKFPENGWLIDAHSGVIIRITHLREREESLGRVILAFKEVDRIDPACVFETEQEAAAFVIRILENRRTFLKQDLAKVDGQIENLQHRLSSLNQAPGEAPALSRDSGRSP